MLVDRWFLRLQFACLAGLLLVAQVLSKHYVVRVGFFAASSTVPSNLAAARKGYELSFNSSGLNDTLEIRWEKLSSGAAAWDSIYNNELDIIATGSPPFAYALKRGAKVVSVQGEYSIKSPYESCIARRTTNAGKRLDSPKDFNSGRVVIGTPLASTAHMQAALMLDVFGLSVSTGGISIVHTPPAEMEQKLLSGAIDCACVWQPWSQILLKTLPPKGVDVFEIWDLDLSNLYGPKQHLIFGALKEYVDHPEYRPIVDHFVRVNAAFYENYLLDKTNARWQKGSSMFKEMVAWNMGFPNDIGDGQDLFSVQGNANLASTVLPALTSASTVLYDFGYIRNDVNVSTADLKSAMDMSFAMSIKTNGTVSPYTQVNVTFENVIALTSPYTSPNKTTNPNKCSNDCTSSECKLDYTQTQKPKTKFLYCAAGINNRTTWTFYPSKEGDQVIVEFKHVSLRRRIDKVTIVASCYDYKKTHNSPNSYNCFVDGFCCHFENKRVIATLEGRKWDAGWSTWLSRQSASLPVFFGQKGERIEIILESNTVSAFTDADKIEMDVYAMGTIKDSDVNQRLCDSAFCTGHGACVDNNKMGAVCACHLGWYGMNCSQPFCLGTTIVMLDDDSPGVIKSNAQQLYASDAQCLWIFRTRSDRAIEFSVDFKLEKGFDSLKTFSGIESRQTMVQRDNYTTQFSGSGTYTIVATEPNFAFLFESDGMISQEGVTISYKLLPPGSLQCTPLLCKNGGICQVKTGKCICLVGWSGSRCNIPYCSNGKHLRYFGVEPGLHNIGTNPIQEGTVYQPGSSCSWEFEDATNAVGIRVFPDTFDVDPTEVLKFVVAYGKKSIEYNLVTDTSEWAKDCNYPSGKPCRFTNLPDKIDKTVSVVEYYVPPTTCRQAATCFLDIMTPTTETNIATQVTAYGTQVTNKTQVTAKVMSSVTAKFMSSANKERGGFKLRYILLPFKSGNFTAVKPTNVFAYISKHERTGVHGIRVQWAYERYRSAAPAVDVVEGFKIRAGGGKKSFNTIVFEKTVYNAEPSTDGVYSIFVTSAELQSGKQHWFSVQTLYHAYGEPAYGSERGSSISESPQAYAEPIHSACLPSSQLFCCKENEYYYVTAVPFSDRKCHPCPPAATCSGKAVTDIVPSSGAWKVTWEEPNVTWQYKVCIDPMVCTPEGCKEGYAGPMCGACAEGFAKRGRRCHTCAFQIQTLVVGLISGALLLCLLFILFVAKGPLSKVERHPALLSLRAWMKRYQKVYGDALRIVKVIVGFLQVSGNVDDAMSTRVTSNPSDSLHSGNVPEIFSTFMVSFSLFNADLFSLLGISCATKIGPYGRMVCYGLFPFFCLVFAYLYDRQRWKKIDKKYHSNTKRDITVAIKDLRLQFEYTDVDDSGEFDKLEFFQMLLGYDVRVSRKRSDVIFDAIDTDRSATVDFDEFVKGLESNTVPIDGWRFIHGLKQKRLRASITAFCVYTLLFLHTPVTKHLLAFWDCQKIEPSPQAAKLNLPTRYFLVQDTSVLCFGDEWLYYLPFNLIFIITFSLGFPAYLVYLLWKFRRGLYTKRVMDQIGIFYKHRRKGCAWWEVFEIFRRFLNTGFVAMLPTRSLKLGTVICVGALSITLLNYFRPEKRHVVFQMHQLSYAATTGVYLCVLMISLAKSDGSGYLDETAIGYLMVAMNCVIFFMGFFAVWFGAKQLAKDVDEARSSEVDMGLRKVTISSHFVNRETLIEMAPVLTPSPPPPPSPSPPPPSPSPPPLRPEASAANDAITEAKAAREKRYQRRKKKEGRVSRRKSSKQKKRRKSTII